MQATDEKTKTEDRAASQARAQLDCIIEMLTAYNKAEKHGEVTYEGYDYGEDSMREAITEDALSVEVRSDWHYPGSEDGKPTEFNILLCTGGPAVRIIGDLDQYMQPDSARIEYQDWGTPWTEYFTADEDQEALDRFCGFFYFGD